MNKRPTQDGFSDELISAFLDGELTAEEQSLVEQQLLDSVPHRRMFEELRALRNTLQELPVYNLEEDLTERILKRADEARMQRNGMGRYSSQAKSDPSKSDPSKLDPSQPAAGVSSVWHWKTATWILGGIALSLLVALLAAPQFFADRNVAQDDAPTNGAQKNRADADAGQRGSELELADRNRRAAVEKDSFKKASEKERVGDSLAQTSQADEAELARDDISLDRTAGRAAGFGGGASGGAGPGGVSGGRTPGISDQAAAGDYSAGGPVQSGAAFSAPYGAEMADGGGFGPAGTPAAGAASREVLGEAESAEMTARFANGDEPIQFVQLALSREAYESGVFDEVLARHRIEMQPAGGEPLYMYADSAGRMRRAERKLHRGGEVAGEGRNELEERAEGEELGDRLSEMKYDANVDVIVVDADMAAVTATLEELQQLKGQLLAMEIHAQPELSRSLELALTEKSGGAPAAAEFRRQAVAEEKAVSEEEVTAAPAPASDPESGAAFEPTAPPSVPAGPPAPTAPLEDAADDAATPPPTDTDPADQAAAGVKKEVQLKGEGEPLREGGVADGPAAESGARDNQAKKDEALESESPAGRAKDEAGQAEADDKAKENLGRAYRLRKLASIDDLRRLTQLESAEGGSGGGDFAPAEPATAPEKSRPTAATLGAPAGEADEEQADAKREAEKREDFGDRPGGDGLRDEEQKRENAPAAPTSGKVRIVFILRPVDEPAAAAPAAPAPQ